MVVISGVISPLVWVITIVTLLITPLITTHEPPSKGLGGGCGTSYKVALLIPEVDPKLNPKPLKPELNPTSRNLVLQASRVDGLGVVRRREARKRLGIGCRGWGFRGRGSGASGFEA